MNMAIARILARYLASALVTAGILAPDFAAQIGADPDVILLLGAVIGAVAEWAYARAKKNGGPT